MNHSRSLLLIICFLSLTVLISCYAFDNDENVIFRGRVVEAFDSDKPVDSVLVQGCIQQLSLFPSWPSCDVEMYTDLNGRFYLAFEVDKLHGRFVRYSKEGYRSLDSCRELTDGRLECYLEALSTVFYIYTPQKYPYKGPSLYDSAVVHVRSEVKDTTFYFWRDFVLNSNSDTIYVWRYPTLELDYIRPYMIVPDNSRVHLKADYFIDDESVLIDSASFFCKKGLRTRYFLSDE